MPSSKKTKAPTWPSEQRETRRIDQLKPYPKNARTHTAAQVIQAREAIEEYGWTYAILVDEKDEILAGHRRHLAAQLEDEKRGWKKIEQVPVIIARGWPAAKKKAYRIWDNKSAIDGGWDDALLRSELGEIHAAHFDLNLVGFSLDELSGLGVEGFDRSEAAEETPPLPKKPVVRLGELWILGEHRVLCGDSTSAEDVARLLGSAVPDIANCDPPYGISVVKRASIGGAKPFGKVGGGKPHPFKGSRGREHGPARKAIIQPGIYEPVIGDDSTKTAITSYRLMVDIGIPVIVMWGGNYFANELPASRCWLVWDKENTGSFADAELAWTNQNKIVRLLRHQWSGLIKASERSERRVHPTQKPVALAEWVIETLAPSAKTLLDLFLGSGSSLIACERKGLKCFRDYALDKTGTNR